MYQVHRANGQVTICNWNGKVMYLTFDNSIVLYKSMQRRRSFPKR